MATIKMICDTPNTKIKRRRPSLFPIILVLLVFLSATAAQAAPARSQATKARQRAEFASFVDGFFAGIQKDWHIPGMSFVAVQDGEVLYLNSYGVADLESGEPVSPDATLFRIGSISKAFTASAVFQLVEKGRLAMDEDVNLYLRGWRLPDFKGDPVSLRHLLTHTAGFDDKELEICAPTSKDERSFGARIQKIMPARYAEAGRYYSDSSMGYALLGSIVVRYSRQPFHSAIEKHIFQPLGMPNSTFSPDPEHMGRLASGYDSSGSVVPYQYRYDMPAMGMSSSARDMGRFMMAQLGGGALGRGRILEPMYAGSMMRTHFTPHPAIDGTAIPYQERRIAGLRTLQMKGNIPGYSSFMMLIPERKFGLFYAANTSNLGFEKDLAAAIASRFFADSASGDKRLEALSALPRPETVRPGVAGYYRLNQISRRTAEKITKLMADQIEVLPFGEGISVSLVRGAEGANVSKTPQLWLRAGDAASEASGDIYIKDGSPGETIFFQRDASGHVQALVIGDVHHTYDKLKKVEWYNWQTVFIACFIVIAIFSGFGMFLGFTVNKGKLPWEKGLRAATELWAISTIFCLIQFAFAGALRLSDIYMGEEFSVFVPYQVKALFVLPLAGGLLLAWFWFRIFGNILNPDNHWAEKVLLILIAVGETGYMFFLANWQLLGFMF